MKAAVVTQAGRTPVFGDFPEPVAQAGELSVTVSAAALSPLARARASGAHYSSGGAFPFVAGVDGVGRDETGRRVYVLLPRAPFGAMAERTVASADQCLELPDGLDDATAAAIANPGMSSWAALAERARLQAGETVLVNGATGASGALAVPIARHLGAGRVIATGRDAAALAALDADAAILLGEDADALERAFAERFAEGVDVVLDYLWGPSARSLLAAAAKAAPGGRPVRFVQIGGASAPEIAMPAAALRSAPLVMMGSGLGSLGLDRLIASVAGVFGAAQAAGFATPHRLVPLRDVEAAWGEAGPRLVFAP